MFTGYCTSSHNIFIHLYGACVCTHDLHYNGLITCCAPTLAFSLASNCTFKTCTPAGGNTPIAANPLLQLVEDSKPCLCAEHRNGNNNSRSHPSPSKPASHKHTPSMQSPRMEQSRGQRGSLQSMPVNNGSHKQLSLTHLPRPEQKL